MERHPPFTDLDLRLIVTQAIKTSNIPLHRLVQLFEEYQTEPNWEKMELPFRRTIEDCKDAFERLRPGQPSPFPRQETPSNPNKRKSGLSPLESAPGGSGGSAAKKRLSVISGTTEKGAQHILPKPPSTGSSPSVTAFPPATAPTPKRRGRPPKAVVEQRHQDQIAKGEILAPGPMPLPPIQFPQPEPHTPLGFAQIAPRSGMHSPALPAGSLPEISSIAPKRPRSGHKPAKKETPLGPGENMFSVQQPQQSNPEPREGYQPAAPRETMQAAPTASQVESTTPARRTPPAPVEEPPRPLAKPAPPQPPPPDP